MTKNYEIPLNIQIINKGNTKDSFVPYKENFPVEIAKENSKEIAIITPEEAVYYLLQANEHLEVKLK